MIAKQSTRKSRTKLRKPKYLSLRLQLTPPPMPPTNHHDHKQQQLNLFPLHPENLVEQDKLDEEPIMANMFSSCDDVDGAATTLTGILCTEAKDEKEDNVHDTNNVPSPSSVADEEVELVRTAMRRNKTDKVHDQEKWVCYSEVVDRKKAVREISSSSSTTTASCRRQNSNSNSNNNNRNPLRNKLVLKLDYEKIMKSWVNKGPLYISDVDAPQPQTVPDLQDDHDFFLPSSINVKTHGEQDNGGNGGSWTVPQMTHIENNGISRGDDALQAGESSPVAHPHNREASVQRYKEKRRNRLFAKTVRYEVRKLNAEKRPRVKGRFVKSS
ncbi:putative transcription factor C2C2-CO-like family [Helianthus annuus]|nr:putative transcription factor C2C2-CO-like family [Helianthus annuus]